MVAVVVLVVVVVVAVAVAVVVAVAVAVAAGGGGGGGKIRGEKSLATLAEGVSGATKAHPPSLAQVRRKKTRCLGCSPYTNSH